MKWLLLAGAIASQGSASLALKAALENSLLFVVVGVCYVAAFSFLSGVLRRSLALSVAYGIWAALVALLATVIFGEPLTLLMLAGISLVIGRVMCVERRTSG